MCVKLLSRNLNPDRVNNQSEHKIYWLKCNKICKAMQGGQWLPDQL